MGAEYSQYEFGFELSRTDRAVKVWLDPAPVWRCLTGRRDPLLQCRIRHQIARQVTSELIEPR